MNSEKVVSASLFLALVVGLSGCGSSGGVKKLFTEEVIVLNTVYEPEQSLAIVGTPAAYPDDWNSSPDPASVVKPSLSPLEGSLTSNLGQTLEDGSQTKPFNEASLQWNYLNQPTNSSVFQDPNAYVKSRSEELYDLRWGELDANGPSYAANYSVSPYWYQPSSPLTIWGKEVSGSVTTEGPRLVSPGYDVLESWRLGWTGLDTTILVIDDLFDTTHGAIVSGIANQIAPGARILGKDFSYTPSYQDSLAPVLLDGSDSGLTGTDKVHAVNLSFSPYPQFLDSATLASSLKDLTGFRYTGVRLSDAVIAVAAGNGTFNDLVPVEVSETTQPLAWTLLNDGALQSRTLVVGALNVDTATGTKSLASYSNFPGANASTQSRFLVASGHANWVDGYFAIDGIQETDPSAWTSYATPRVTAIASIVRQKFPNLSGEQTANVLLSTATYETLGCHPSCSPSLYGQGEVSLRRALAPVGRLR